MKPIRYVEPDRLPGEGNWQWCQRIAATMPPELIVRKLIRYLNRMESRRRIPTWSIVSDATGHGCGVSTAIVEHYSDPEENSTDRAPWTEWDAATQEMVCPRCGERKGIPAGSLKKFADLITRFKRSHSSCKGKKNDS